MIISVLNIFGSEMIFFLKLTWNEIKNRKVSMVIVKNFDSISKRAILFLILFLHYFCLWLSEAFYSFLMFSDVFLAQQRLPLLQKI